MFLKWLGILFLLFSISCATSGLTYKKYMNFLYDNDISEKQWIWKKYMCANFALDTVRALRDNGFPAYPMLVDFKGSSSHMAVAFQVEGKWCFIEPQADVPFLDYWYGLQYRASVYENCYMMDNLGRVHCSGLKLRFWV